MFFLWLILIVLLITALFYTLSIKLEFENFVISFPEKSENNKNGNGNGKIKLKVYIFKLIKIVDMDLKKIKRKNIKLEQIKNILKSLKQKRDTRNLKITDMIKELNIDVLKINLEITIGIKDAATTSILIGILYMVLEKIIIDKSMKNNNRKCLIMPEYQKEIILIKLDSIFEFNMRNIINTIFNQIRRSVNKNGTSNRKLNVNSNEQY